MRSVVRRASLVVTLVLASTFFAALADGSGLSSAPKSLGLLTSVHETPTYIYARDDGLSVRLPNHKDLWIFGDGAKRKLVTMSGHLQWVKVGFVPDSSAALAATSLGTIPHAMREISVGHSTNAPSMSQFIGAPTDTVMPDGSGRACTRANGASGPVRWPSGAALLDDQSVVLVTYEIACVLPTNAFTVEGWGFAEYRWTTNSFTVAPRDVMTPAPDGTPLATSLWLSTPVVHHGLITLYVSQPCDAAVEGPQCTSWILEQVTLPDNIAALSTPSNYVPSPVAVGSGFTWSGAIKVADDGGRGYFAVDQTPGSGQVTLAYATSPVGPFWFVESANSPCHDDGVNYCRAFVIHPELATTARWVLTYYDPNQPSVTSAGHLVGIALPAVSLAPPKPSVLAVDRH